MDGIDYFAPCIFPSLLNAHVLLLSLGFPLLDLCFIASREFDFGESEAFVTSCFVGPILVPILVPRIVPSLVPSIVPSSVTFFYVPSLVIRSLGRFFDAFNF